VSGGSAGTAIGHLKIAPHIKNKSIKRCVMAVLKGR
jgi:hypothetical protein